MLALGEYRAGGSAIVDLLAACEPRFDGEIVSCVRGQEVLGEGDPTQNFLLVLNGLFRGVRTTPDGRRQVFAFYMTGDLCGLENGERHKLAVEAVDVAEVAVLPRQACRQWMKESPEISAAWFDAATFALTLTVDHMMMIGCGLAEEKLAWFLTVRAPRLVNPDARMVDLAMRRQDIADYLGLTIETVSRTLTLFKEQSLIRIHKLSRVEILRPDVLARLSAVDREARLTLP
jgi:CRP/FNR family transcriptional regulator, nitrogen fixation regulation protein